MDCQTIKDKFPDYLTGELEEKEVSEIQNHCLTCASCREELVSLSEVWTKLGVLPEERPSPALRNRFYTMLENFKGETEPEKRKPALGHMVTSWLENFWSRKPAFQFTVAFLLLVVGLAGGYFLGWNTHAKGEVANLRRETQNLRQMMAVSLLNQSSPIERLEGVSWTSQLEKPSQETLEALFHTLNTDPNVNVRLAVIDALYLFRNNPRVKQEITQSLSRQTSPLVQLALIEFMVEIREGRAIDALRQLIKNKTLNPDIKERAKLGIQELSKEEKL